MTIIWLVTPQSPYFELRLSHHKEIIGFGWPFCVQANCYHTINLGSKAYQYNDHKLAINNTPLTLANHTAWYCLAASVNVQAILCNFSSFYSQKNWFQTAIMSMVRQNYHEDSEAAVNKQINLELYASYAYQSMVSETENRWKVKVETFIIIFVKTINFMEQKSWAVSLWLCSVINWTCKQLLRLPLSNVNGPLWSDVQLTI